MADQPHLKPVGAGADRDAIESAVFEIKRVIAGQDEMLERVFVCLLAGGHLLIEGVPGLAKTLTIETVAECSAEASARPVHAGSRPLRPRWHADVPHGEGHVRYRARACFCKFLLADEINRAPAKVQSALLEVMQERQVTIGKETHPVPSPFLVMATQNPIESEGTYPLPEAQVDRFMLKVLVDYPAPEDELTVIERALAAPVVVEQLLSVELLAELQQEVSRIYVDPAVSRYALSVALATRRLGEAGLDDLAAYVDFGASPRGPINLVLGARRLLSCADVATCSRRMCASSRRTCCAIEWC